MFDPKAHLIQLPRRVYDKKHDRWVVQEDDYLEVKWRLVWFRDTYPHGTIMTKPLLLDWENGVAIFQARVGDGEGGIASGTGTEIRPRETTRKGARKGFEDFVEKAETRSIGRALANLGIGTQFVGEELSEGEHIADGPIQTPTRASATDGPAGDMKLTETPPDREGEMKAYLLDEIMGTLKRTVPGTTPDERARRLDLISTAFEVKGWNRLKDLTSTQLQAGFSHLRKLVSEENAQPDALESDVVDEEDVPDSALVSP